MGEWELYWLFDLLDLLVESSDVGVGLLGGLLQLHNRHHRVCVVAQHTHHSVDLNIRNQVKHIGLLQVNPFDG